MDRNGKRSIDVESQSLRWGGHKRVQRTVSLSADLDAWLERERKASGFSFSEVVNRELKKQHDLRAQLSALSAADPEQQTPVFQVLLEQHGQKVSKTVDGAMKRLAEHEQALAVLGRMIAMLARIAMNPEQFNQWERGVYEAKRKEQR